MRAMKTAIAKLTGLAAFCTLAGFGGLPCLCSSNALAAAPVSGSPTAQNSVIGLVAQDQASLRAAPKDSAQVQAVLWQGDSLEIRGERLDYLQVYDHRRERAGYIKASQVRRVSLKAEDAPELMSVVRFLRDTPGAEALGIAYTAAFLKAAPASAIGPETFDALGSMAERLARRGSARQGKTNDPAVAAHLEVVAQYGVTINAHEVDDQMHLCYDGDAFRRVLAQPASGASVANSTNSTSANSNLLSNLSNLGNPGNLNTNAQKARAALALTRQDCIDPAIRPLERISLDQWRAEVLDRVELVNVPEYLKNRIRMRRAGVWSGIAYQRSRKGDTLASQDAANRALTELADVDKNDMPEADGPAFAEAGVRVGATRWAVETMATPQDATAPKTGLGIVTSAGQPGETCVALVEAGQKLAVPAHTNTLTRRCTYGVVWNASARANATGSALVLAVQPMEGWRELWLFHRNSQGWMIEVLPPASTNPDLGYAEFAGWVPGSNKMLVAREARLAGRFVQRFEVFNIDTLQVENGADKPGSLSVFHRWQDAIWKRQTVSLR